MIMRVDHLYALSILTIDSDHLMFAAWMLKFSNPNILRYRGDEPSWTSLSRSTDWR
jgi:hypothetical protein